VSKTFEFEIAEGTNAAEVLARAREEARSSGIALEGTDQAGRFKGTADGAYTVEGSTLKVEVTNKPSFVPWGMIEKALRKVFA